MNLVKVGDHYEASPDDGGALLLCDPAGKYCDRVCYNAPGQWVDEVTWVSKTTFILAGISKSSPDSLAPYILIGDTEKKILQEYLNTNPKCFQHGYHSPKLKRIKIEGL